MITSKQRAYLRGLANTIDPIFQIGKGGINENLIKQLDDALEARELIKLHVLETAFMDSRETLSELAEILGAEPVQANGSKIDLYRESQNKKKIEL